MHVCLVFLCFSSELQFNLNFVKTTKRSTEDLSFGMLSYLQVKFPRSSKPKANLFCIFNS